MESLTTIIADTNFSVIDWGIVLVYLVLSVGIGIIANRYVGSLSDYIVAGRGMRTALGIATLTGTEMGLVTVMYSAQKGFSGGFAAFHIGIISGALAFFIGVTGFIVTRLRRERVLTIPEYYGRRYGKGVQVFGGIMLSFGGIFNMGMFLKAGSMFIVGITGMQSEIALTTVMVVLLGLVLFYTVMGGMISVILTDYVQFVVLSFGLVLATMLCLYTLGWEHIFNVVIEEKGEVAFNPVAEGSSFGFDYVLWMAFLGLVNCALWPTAVARALAADSEATVKKQFMFSSITFAIRNIVPYFWGICAFVFIMGMPALKTAFFPGEDGGAAIDTLYAMPIFLGQILPVGVIGLLTAAMIAAFMSTHDSYLLCWSSVLTNDVAKPLLGDRLTDKGAVLLTRIFVVAIGVLILFISLIYPLQADLWDFMAVTGGIYFIGAFALLAAGLYWKPASKGGAICALALGGLNVFGLPTVQKAVLNFLGYTPDWIAAFNKTCSSERVGLATVVLALAGMIVGSLLFPDQTDNNDTEAV